LFDRIETNRQEQDELDDHKKMTQEDKNTLDNTGTVAHCSLAFIFLVALVAGLITVYVRH
jgi:hypothetical protein